MEVIALNRSRVGLWRMRRDIYDLCRRLRPAIVHTRNLSGLDALLPARLAGVRRTVHGEHGWDVDDLKGEARRPALLRRLHAPLVRRYITVSKDLERYLVRRVGIAPARITQIYNGVDIARFAPDPARTRNASARRASRRPDAVVIGTVGRIQQVKDHATLLRGLRGARERPTPAFAARARLAIVGDGPLLARPPRARGFARDRAATWFPGNRTDVADVLRAFDVFALPSLNEGISNTILEAMASGLPVVATAVGGNVELVDDGCDRPPGAARRRRRRWRPGARRLRGRARPAARPRPARAGRRDRAFQPAGDGGKLPARVRGTGPLTRRRGQVESPKTPGLPPTLLQSPSRTDKLPKPNYAFAKRQRDLAKKQKKEEKQKKKLGTKEEGEASARDR